MTDLEAIKERINCPSAVQAVQIGEYESCARCIVEHDAPALVAELEAARKVCEAAFWVLGDIRAGEPLMANEVDALEDALDEWERIRG